MQIFHNPNYDFVKWRWPAIGLSLLVVFAGIFLLATRGPKLGVEFEGGHRHPQVQQPTSDERVRSALTAHAGRRRRKCPGPGLRRRRAEPGDGAGLSRRRRIGGSSVKPPTPWLPR